MIENIQKLTPRLAIDKLRTAIGSLNDTQKRDVKAMGFGDVLEMNEIKLPLNLASALFHYYDPKSSSLQIISTELKITEETDLTITKESVHAIFGFPMGMFQVELPEKTSKHLSKDDPVTCKWQEQFKDKVDQFHKITVDMVFNMMASQGSGGLEFKQNFLVYVLTILGTGPQTGFVDQDCLHKLDADRISQIDWCTYILNALNKRRKEWTPTDSIKQNFVVPLALLVFFYVHSTRDKSDAAYTLPAIRYLTRKLLLDRKEDHLHFDRKEDLNDIKSEQVNNLDDGETKSEEFYLQTIEALVTEAYTHYPNSEKLKVLQTALHKSSPLSHHTPPSPLSHHTPSSPFSLLFTPQVKKTESQEEGHKKRESPLVLEEQLKCKRPRGRPYGDYDFYAKINPENVKMVASEVSDPNSTLKSLAPSQEISTHVVSEYFNWLEIRNKKAPRSFLNCYFFHPYFYTKLVEKGYNYNSVKSWTKMSGPKNLFQYQKIFVPIISDKHWCLGVINIVDNQFQYFDSVSRKGDQVLENLAKYFEDERNDKKANIDLGIFTKVNIEELPRQDNGYDCGMFMMMYADFCCRPKVNINFNQSHIPNFRIKVAWNILKMHKDEKKRT